MHVSGEHIILIHRCLPHRPALYQHQHSNCCQIASTSAASLLPRSHFSWIHDSDRCLRNPLLIMVAAAAHSAAASTQQQQQQAQHQPTQQQQPPAGGQQEQQQSQQPQQPVEDKWEVNKPVERRSQVLTEELNDCLGRFWTWVSCGGPAARMRQLYVNGRLSRYGSGTADELDVVISILIVSLNGCEHLPETCVAVDKLITTASAMVSRFDSCLLALLAAQQLLQQPLNSRHK